MNSAHMLPEPDTQGRFVVLPFDAATSPYLTSQPHNDPGGDCAIIEMDLLKSLQEDLILSAAREPRRQRSLSTVLAAHAKTQKKIQLKEMEGFGKGTFSKALIRKNEVILYPAFIYMNSEDNNNDHEYAFIVEGRDNLIFDAKHREGLGKYFQHLPTNCNAELNNKVPQLANFEGTDIITGFDFNNTFYYIRLSVLFACKDIPAGQLLGYDYGFGYWHQARPTQFEKNGDPIPNYLLMTDLSTVNNLNGFNSKLFNEYLRLKFLVSGNICTVLPKETVNAIMNFKKTLPVKHGATDIIIPHIFYCILDGNVSFRNDTFQPFIIIKLKPSLLPPPSHPLVNFIDGKMATFNLHELADYSATEMIRFANYCNQYFGINCDVKSSKVFQRLSADYIEQENTKKPSLNEKQLLFSLNPSTLFKKCNDSKELSLPLPKTNPNYILR